MVFIINIYILTLALVVVEEVYLLLEFQVYQAVYQL
jgi:hypothetical protein